MRRLLRGRRRALPAPGFIDACVNVAGIGYAIPGTVLALGLLTPLVLVDEGLNAVARAFGGNGVGLILAGSVAALIIAYVIRFLAIALGFAQAGFSRISPEFDDVARMLGAGPATLARTIHGRCCARRSGARRCWCSSIA